MTVAMPSLELPEMPDLRVDDAPATPAPVTDGRLRNPGLTETDRNFSIATHLSPLSAFILGPPALLAPLVLWLVRKDVSQFNDDHGREVINFGLSIALWHLLLGLTMVGMILFPALWIVAIVNVVRATGAASRGEYFRYPITVRFLSG